MKVVKKTLVGLGLLGMAAAVLIAAVPSQQRAIPLNSSTAVSVSKSTTQTGTVSAAVSTSAFDIDPNQGSNVADFYNGLLITVSGCAATKNGEYLITDYDGADEVTISPAATAGPDPNCTYTIGPSLPSNIREITIGGCAGTCYYSTRSGGTAATDRFKLSGGQFRTILSPRKYDYIEFLSVSATDTLYLEWN